MKIEMKLYDPAKHANTVWKYAHIKRDGHFLKVQMGVNDKLYCWTSNPTDITDKLQFCRWFDAAKKLPRGVSLLGELWLPGHRSEAIKTAIKDENDKLQFDVFAIDNWRIGGSIHDEIHNRLVGMPLEDVELLVCQLGFAFIPFFKQPFNMKNLQDFIKLNPSMEGFVLKNGNLLDWTKLKPRKTLDVIVTKLLPGQGKYLNMLGSLVCETSEGFEVASVSGMSDQQRRWMTNHTDEILGKVIEVEYQNIGANGRLRHPVFVRTREDKEKEHCPATQDDDLRAYWLGDSEQPLLRGLE